MDVTPWRRTQAAASEWEAIGASPWLARGIKFGFKARFILGREVTPFRSRPYPVSRCDQEWVATEMDRWVNREFVRELSRAEGASSRYLSSAFVIEGRKKRIVVDLRPLNEQCIDLPGKMEGLRILPSLIEPDDHLISWDWRDGYHHFRIHPDHRVYFRFQILGRYFESVTLPFGWNQAPGIFTKAMRPFLQELRKRGIAVMGYLDDFLGRPRTLPGIPSAVEDCTRATEELEDLFLRLGLDRHPDKGEWNGAQVFEHLGLIVDTRRRLFLVPPAKVAKIEGHAHALIGKANSSARKVPASELRRFAGLAMSVHLAVPLAQFYTRSLFSCLGNIYVGRVQLSHRAVKDLHWWASLGRQKLGRALWDRECGLVMTTDASDFGWGATLGSTPAAGIFTLDEQEWHINLKELKTIRLALHALDAEGIRGQRIQLFTDSQVVLHVVRKMVSRSPELMEELRKLQYILDWKGVQLKLEYIPSAFNVWADQLSRRRSSDDWHLADSTFSLIDKRLGPHTVDRFAGVHNARLPRYNSLHADPGAEAVNALSVPWKGEVNYCCPPFDLIPLVLEKARAERVACTLVIPAWPSQPWWPRLEELMVEKVILWGTQSVCIPDIPGTVVEPLRNPAWLLWAVRLNTGNR